MSNIDFSNVSQTPDNVSAITGTELLFGAPNRTTPPKVYKFPFSSSGVTNPVVSFYGIIAGRNNFTVTDGSVTNIKVLGDLVGFGTASPDAAITVVKDGSYANNLLSLKNASNVSTQASVLAISYGASGLLVNGKMSVFNNAYTDVGALRKNSMNIDSDGAKGLSFSASNAAGYISVYTAGTADVNERIRVFANGNTSLGFTSYADNGYKLEVNGTVKATTFVGSVDWVNLTFGVTPTLPAPAINTNTTQAATTAFVQSRSRSFNYSAPMLVSTPTTIAATDNGKRISVIANVMVTLPTLASVTDGISFFFKSNNNAWTLSGNGAETIIGNPTSVTRVMQPYEIIEISKSAAGWEIVNSTFDNSALKFAALANPIFDSGAGANGESDVGIGTGGVRRFYESLTGTSGATLALNYCDGAGAYAGIIYSIARSNGAVTFSAPVTLNGVTNGVTQAVGNNTTLLATTAHVYASIVAGAVAPRDGKLGRVLTELDGINPTWKPVFGPLEVKNSAWTAIIGGNYAYNPSPLAATTVTFPNTGLVADDLIRLSDILGNCVNFPLSINFGGIPFRSVVQVFTININNVTCFFRYVDATIGWIIE